MAVLRLTLFGTGALATWLGARLASSSSAVTLVGTWREALDVIARRGLTILGTPEAEPVAARSAHVHDDLDPAPLVLVLVKSQRTAAVAAAVARATSPTGLVLSLQNGLGNREALAAAAGAERVALGVAFLGATLVGPGAVRPGGGSRIVIERHARGDLARRVLCAAGFDVEVTDDIRPALWSKLAVNCALNPLTALRRVPNGALIEEAESRALVEAAACEVGAVAKALGIDLGADPAELAVEVARATATNRSSMLQDVDRGVPTEIEALNGALVREAERVGVATPVNRRLLDEVRRLEAERGMMPSTCGRPSSR
jgi:2-dehydropantoate 2-reductase